MATSTQADTILNTVYQTLNLANSNTSTKYSNIVAIVTQLQSIHSQQSINVGTTGTISERLCKLGIDSVPTLVGQTRKYGNDWKWLGDFLLPGHPYDVAVSVKSFKAKERLLASGTGSLLTPTIGWGLFDDPNEWSENRARSYLYRGFVSIYMPIATLNMVSQDAKNVRNINGNILLRDLASFSTDLVNAIPTGHDRIDTRAL
jgi:hypothetical protein